jgi:hypothetical protein
MVTLWKNIRFSFCPLIFLFLAAFSTPCGKRGKSIFQGPFVERFSPFGAGNAAFKREMVSSSFVP